MNSFWRDARASSKSATVGIPTAVGLCVALAGSFWNPLAPVSISLIGLVGLGSAVYAVCAVLVDMTVKARRLARGVPPKVIHVDLTEPLRLLTEPSRFFSVNLLVTIYQMDSFGAGSDEVFERSIGVGEVANIQENGLIQVVVVKEVSRYAETWQRIRKSEKTTLSQIIIKPSVGFADLTTEDGYNE